jgi:diguanylate cyclase (GGDEF)-like protein
VAWAARGAGASGIRGRILVVDDSPAQAEHLEAALVADGHEVAIVGDGASAIRAVRTRPPDLVLLDMFLPDMDGVQVLRIVKARPAHEFIPVILLSVRADLDERVKGLRIGADDFLAKPWAEAEVQARAMAMLRIKRLQDELRSAKAQLELLCVTDGLTGLHNRRFLEQRLPEEFARVLRYGDPLALMMLDLDHFKDVNDTYGHPFGDLVLKATGAALRSITREVDLCCRYGGEEFAVVLPRTGAAGAQKVAERLLKRMREPLHRFPGAGNVPAADVRVTASIGIAAFPEVDDAEALIQRADEALYASKRRGRDQVTLHVPRPVHLIH